MKKGSWILLILGFILCFCLGFVARAYLSANQSSTQTIPIKQDGSFVLTHNGVKKTVPATSGSVFHWYFDAYCPDCIRAEKYLGDFVKQVTQKGGVVVLHPLNYLSHKSGIYSVSLAAWISAVAGKSEGDTNQNGPVLRFMSRVVSEDFRNQNKAKRKEELHRALAVEAKKELGEKTTEQIRQQIDQYEAAINRASVNIRKMEKWQQLSPKSDHRFFVPFVYEEGKKAIDGENKMVGKLLSDLGETCSSICQD